MSSTLFAADLRELLTHLSSVYAKLTPHGTISTNTQAFLFEKESLRDSAVIPQALYRPLYVRPLYWRLLDKLMDGEAVRMKLGTVVTGNPGELVCRR